MNERSTDTTVRKESGEDAPERQLTGVVDLWNHAEVLLTTQPEEESEPVGASRRNHHKETQMTQEINSDPKYPQPSAVQKPANATPLRDDIARARSALSEDVKAPGEKLDPERLKHDVKEVIHHARDATLEGAKDIVHDAKTAAVDTLRGAKDHALESISEGMTSVGRHARAATQTASRFTAAHAIPLALVGAGAGWLLLSLSHQRRQRHANDVAGSVRPYDRSAGSATPSNGKRKRASVTSRATDAIEVARERVVDGAHAMESRVMESAGDLRDKITQGATHFGHETAALSRRAYAGMGRVGTRALELCEDNPISIALLAIASGTAFGMLLPSTRRENALLGDTRDKLVERVQRSATDFKGSMERRVDEVRDIIEEVRQPSSHA